VNWSFARKNDDSNYALSDNGSIKALFTGYMGCKNTGILRLELEKLNAISIQQRHENARNSSFGGLTKNDKTDIEALFKFKHANKDFINRSITGDIPSTTTFTTAADKRWLTSGQNDIAQTSIAYAVQCFFAIRLLAECHEIFPDYL